MRKLFLLALLVLGTMLLTACGSDSAPKAAADTKTAVSASEKTSAETSASSPQSAGKGKVLVAYFSRAGNNYQVGYIQKGNTHIMADMIAETTGADTFEIKTVKSYPKDYRECTEVAAKEREANARPELSGKVANWQGYDTVFLGYPIWWSDMPMAVYTFMESYDWTGKNVIPFCTSAGDVLTGRESDIPKFAKGATLKEGLGLEGKRVQEQPDAVRPQVEKWLAALGYKK